MFPGEPLGRNKVNVLLQLRDDGLSILLKGNELPLQHFGFHSWPEFHQLFALVRIRLKHIARLRNCESDMKLVESLGDPIEGDGAAVWLQFMLAGDLIAKVRQFLSC
jgi:hypothetical protein